jgi:hypothetical protein
MMEIAISVVIDVRAGFPLVDAEVLFDAAIVLLEPPNVVPPNFAAIRASWASNAPL